MLYFSDFLIKKKNRMHVQHVSIEKQLTLKTNYYMINVLKMLLKI